MEIKLFRIVLIILNALILSVSDSDNKVTNMLAFIAITLLSISLLE